MRRVPTSIHARTAPSHPPHTPHPHTHQQAALLGLGLVRAAQVELAEHLAAPLVAVLQRTCSSTQNRLPRARCSCCSSSTPPASPRTRPEHHARRAAAGRGAYFAFGAHPPRLGRARGPGAEAARLGGRPLLSRSLWLTAREARAEPGAARHSGFLGTGSPPRRVVDIQRIGASGMLFAVVS